MVLERSIPLSVSPSGTAPAVWLRRGAAVGLGLLGAAAAIVLARRAAGALERPLEPAVLALAGLATAAAAAAVRLGWSAAPTMPRFDWAVTALASVAVVTLAVGLCLPGGALVGPLLFCTPPAIVEAWAWTRLLRQQPRRHDAFRPVRRKQGFTESLQRLREPEVADRSEFLSVTQELTRGRTVEGVERLFGRLRMPFAAGRRTGALHVAFCPPFAQTPEVEVAQIDGPEARIKTAQLLPYGVRLDLKLAAPAEAPTAVTLHFTASCPADSIPAKETAPLSRHPSNGAKP